MGSGIFITCPMKLPTCWTMMITPTPVMMATMAAWEK
ncbi:MAG: hypothetical protein BECKG1743D_GA0114223_103213 [Candidatus Kentron sp. G]|nr:MAG: hypothetical protein BECKG1743F_GA0114225_101913 [Candidatus Kentron sp. G]VFM99996.1 MAG: hypothetical protein BECKG1743E_GA0114224_102973 [Candidatus Kentron sp. G]VFN01921.1 MAG: hypothetical protein BECKG1743D_GA0114223_103213 [Candidatus Kentron sp. G]